MHRSLPGYHGPYADPQQPHPIEYTLRDGATIASFLSGKMWIMDEVNWSGICEG